MLHELEQTQPDDKTDVAHVFPELARQIRRRGMVVLILRPVRRFPTLAESLKQFRLRKHEVIVFHVMHDDELTFPFQDNTLFRGLEMPSVQLHTEPRALRKSYLEAVERFHGRRAQDLRRQRRRLRPDEHQGAARRRAVRLLALRQKIRRTSAKRR